MLKKSLILITVGALIALWGSLLWAQDAIPNNHFKGYAISPQPFGFSAFTKDQFMEDGLFLTGPILLANPVQKDTFSIIDTTHHLHWYFAEGRDTLITVNYENQFETTTVEIDSVRFFLVPAQKFPHGPPVGLDHYKCYRIRQAKWLQKSPLMQDQFTEEVADSVMRDLFCTPCRKNAEPMFDTITHYVAYLLAPGQPFIPPLIVPTVDQFGTYEDTVLGSKYILVPTIKHLPTIPPDTGKNHYKTWRVNPEPFTGTAQVRDQFMDDFLGFDRLEFLSNPVRKIVGPDTSKIIDPDDHLTWYRAFGRDTLLSVEYVNQFESTTVVIDSVNYFLVPTTKEPHPPYDSLDHYKAYRIRDPYLLDLTALLQDQFDFPNEELVNPLSPVYFLTPAQKNSEPVYDQVTHYVAYLIDPKTTTSQSRVIQNQFGTDTVSVLNSEMLLVPTRKVSVGLPECSDGIDNDGDGLTDFPADCGCTDAADNSEAPNPPTQCSDGVDNDGDGLVDLADPDCANVCDDEEGVPVSDTGPNHFKTWRIQPVPFTVTVSVEDQFLKDDNIRLDGIEFLSNPTIKIVGPDTFGITDLDEHLNWYRAVGKRTQFKIEYVNQFESTTVLIDSVKYLLVPAQKLPHNPPDSLDHYKAYIIKDTVLLNQAVILDDQFDVIPEQITALSPTYFLTPAIKNSEPSFDTITHYVAYTITPPTTTGEFRTTVDQFGSHPAQALFSELLLVPTKKTAIVCDAIPGDANADLAHTLADVISIVNYVFNKPGCAPQPICWLSGKLCRGDTNGDCIVTLSDVIRMVNFIFSKPCAGPGAPPCCWKPLPCPGSTCCLPVPLCP